MTTTQALAGVLALSVALSFLVLVRTLRSTAVSRYRYLLWQQRDELMDEVLDGKLDYVPEVRDAIDRAEAAVAAAGWVTPYRLWRAKAILRASGLEPAAPTSYEHLPAAQRGLLEEFDKRVMLATTRLLLLGTASGLVLVPLLVVRMAPLVLRSLARGVGRPDGPATSRNEEFWRKGADTFGVSPEALRWMPRDPASPAYS